MCWCSPASPGMTQSTPSSTSSSGQCSEWYTQDREYHRIGCLHYVHSSTHNVDIPIRMYVCTL